MFNLGLEIPSSDLLPYLLGILGLLMTWELHDLEVRAGRIKSSDIRDLNHIRHWLRNCSTAKIYVRMTPNDSHACPACRKISGETYLRTIARRTKFKPAQVECTNPLGCRCVLVGLSRQGPTAAKIADAVREGDTKHIQLSDEELTELLRTTHTPGIVSDMDHVGLSILDAMRAEGVNPQSAISRYRHLIIHAKEVPANPLVVPAYLRLSDLLERTGRFAEALDVVDDFQATVRTAVWPYPPTAAQATSMSVRKSRLLKKLRNLYRAPGSPGTGN